MLKLKDIAEIADVSLATVSLVLNSRNGVSDEKRAFITKLLLENGYQISSPKSKSKKCICFLKFYKHSMLVNGNPGFVNQIIDSIENECKRSNITLMISTAEINSFDGDKLSSLLKTDPVNGIIVLGTELTPEDMKVLASANCPLVVVDNSLEYAPYSCVTMNNATAIRNNVLYLNSLGHKHIGFLANKIPASNCNARRRSYELSMDELGLGDNKVVYEITPSLEGSYEDVYNLLQSGAKFPTAIVANNDCIALGAMRAFQKFGIDVPNDISLIGFDGIEFSAISQPALSTNKVSCKDMGSWTVRLLRAHMEDTEMNFTKIHVNTQTVLRDSVVPYHKDVVYHPSIIK